MAPGDWPWVKKNVLQWRLYQQQKFKHRKNWTFGIYMITNLNLHFSQRVNRAMIKGVAKLSYLNKISFHRYYLLFPSFDTPCQREGGGAKQTEVTHRLWPITTKKCTASFRIPFSLFFFMAVKSFPGGTDPWQQAISSSLKHEALIHITTILGEITTFRNNCALNGGIALLNTSFFLKDVDNKYRSK